MPQEPDFDKIYSLLDVDPGEGWEAVQQAYRRKAQAFHPDRAGGNPRIEKIAKRRFEELNTSFEEIRRFRRIFGDLPPKGLGSTLARSTPVTDEVYVAPRPQQQSRSRSAARWVFSLGIVLILVAAVVIVGFVPD